MLKLEIHRASEADERQAEIFRAMTPAQRLAIAFEMNDFARQLLAGKAKTDHPDWTAEQIEAEVVRRLLDAANSSTEIRHRRP